MRSTAILIPLALATALACQVPTEPSVNYERGACAVEASFCDGRIVQALDPTTVRLWQDAANDYADAHYGEGTRVYPVVRWVACFFDVRGTCCAGYTESTKLIYISTAQDWRTGPLIAHETLHAVYWKRFGDPDATHTKRMWGW